MCPWMHGAQHHRPRNNTGHDSKKMAEEQRGKSNTLRPLLLFTS